MLTVLGGFEACSAALVKGACGECRRWDMVHDRGLKYEMVRVCCGDVEHSRNLQVQ